MKMMFLATLLLFSNLYQNNNPEKVSLSRPLAQKYKEVVLTNLNGQKLKLADCKNKVVFVNFWQSN